MKKVLISGLTILAFGSFAETFTNLTVISNLVVGTGGATGEYAVSEGDGTAYGMYSHAEGASTASNTCAHAEGRFSLASGSFSHAEGSGSIASGSKSHAEGQAVIADGEASHAEGSGTIASATASHAEGFETIASGDCSHAEGVYTVASGGGSHAAGVNAMATNGNTFVWSDGTEISSTTNQQFTVHASNGIRLLGGPIEGDGSGLTNLNAAAIPAGSIDVSQLSTNVIAASITANDIASWNASGNLAESIQVSTGSVAVATNLTVQGTISADSIAAGGEDGSIQYNENGVLAGNTNFFMHPTEHKPAFRSQNGNLFRAYSSETISSNNLIYSLRNEDGTAVLRMFTNGLETVKLSSDGTLELAGQLVADGSQLTNLSSQPEMAAFIASVTSSPASTITTNQMASWTAGGDLAQNIQITTGTVAVTTSLAVQGTITGEGCSLTGPLSITDTTYGFGKVFGVFDTPFGNVTIGSMAGGRDCTATLSTFFGEEAGMDSSGSKNTFIGSGAGKFSQGDRQYGFGIMAGKSTSASNTTYLGRNAGRYNTKEGYLYLGHLVTAPTNEADMWDKMNVIVDGNTGETWLGASNATTHLRGNVSFSSGTISADSLPTSGVWNAAGMTVSDVGSLVVSSNLVVGNGSASGIGAVSEGCGTASGNFSHAEGAYTVASGSASHSEGSQTAASGQYSHAEGQGSEASGDSSSHAEGYETVASGGWGSHAEGYETVAGGAASHSEGVLTVADGDASHAAGYNAKATNDYTFVWSDGMEVSSTTNQQFTVYASNGIRLLGGPIEGDGFGLSNLNVESLSGTIAAANLPTSGVWNASGVVLSNVSVQGSIQGDLDMGGAKIVNLGTAASDTDAASQGRVKMLMQQVPEYGDISMGEFTSQAATPERPVPTVIDTEDIADDAITLDKLDEIAGHTVIGNMTNGYAGPTEIEVKDEDDMASDSDTALVTQQSIKAYVDARVEAAVAKCAMWYSGETVHSGAMPTSWTDLDLSGTVGSNRCFVYLQIIPDSDGVEGHFRENGETALGSVNAGIPLGSAAFATAGIGGSGEASYPVVITDADGVVEWDSNKAGSGGTIVKVLTYQILQ